MRPHFGSNDLDTALENHHDGIDDLLYQVHLRLVADVVLLLAVYCREFVVLRHYTDAVADDADGDDGDTF